MIDDLENGIIAMIDATGVAPEVLVMNPATAKDFRTRLAPLRFGADDGEPERVELDIGSFALATRPELPAGNIYPMTRQRLSQLDQQIAKLWVSPAVGNP